MSQFKDSLSEQMAALKKKQKELELISQIVDYVAKLTSEQTENKEVADKVRDLFTAFANRVVQSPEKKTQSIDIPTPSLKVEGVQVVPSNSENDRVLVQMKPTGDIGSKIKFAMAYRHLENARVKFGDQEGTVRGIDAPNIVIQTDSGQTLEIPPQELTILQGKRTK